MLDAMYVFKQPVANKSGHFRVQLCESEREGKKVKRRIVRSFGIAKSPEELESFVRCANSEMDREMAKRDTMSLLFDASKQLYEAPPQRETEYFPPIAEVKEEFRKKEGFSEVYGTLFEQIFPDILPEKKDNEILKEVVLARIAKPESKRRTKEILERECGFSVSLSAIYRMLDKLYKQEDLILKKCFLATQKLLENKVDMLFFDVTTLYMESFQEDDLRRFGYSKDQKFHQTQVVLALATTAEGLPVGYRLFPGNTGESKTLLKCLEEWSKVLTIGKVYLAADSAMFCFSNLKMLEEKGIEFVVCARLKNLSKSVKNEIVSPESAMCFQMQNGDSLVWYKEIEHEMVNKKEKLNGRLIVTWSHSRAKKDADDRERIVQKLKNKIGQEQGKSSAKKLISNSGYLKYATIGEEKIAYLDEEKIKEDSVWDGLHGVFTNSQKPAKEILSIYRRLFVIEESFRINKNDLAMRPVYHFKENRVRAHIAVCYLAFALIRNIQYRLESKGVKLSPERIRIELNSVEASIYKDRHGVRYRVPSSVSEYAQLIYDSLNMERKTSIIKIR